MTIRGHAGDDHQERGAQGEDEGVWNPALGPVGEGKSEARDHRGPARVVFMSRILPESQA